MTEREMELVDALDACKAWKRAADTLGERLIATEKRLEQCETELKKQAQDHLHYIAACDQTEEELLKRLEQAQAAIAKCKHAGECGYDAARAAMETK